MTDALMDHAAEPPIAGTAPCLAAQARPWRRTVVGRICLAALELLALFAAGAVFLTFVAVNA